MSALSDLDQQKTTAVPADKEPEFGRDFTLIYRHFHPLLVNRAQRRNADDPEGVADLALMDLHRAISTDRFSGDATPAIRAYLYRAVEGHIVAEYRRSRRQVPRSTLRTSDSPTVTWTLRSPGSPTTTRSQAASIVSGCTS